MDGLDKIPAATADDLVVFETAVKLFRPPECVSVPMFRVAAQYARRVDELESMILDHARGLGYDLQCEARKLMEEYDGD